MRWRPGRRDPDTRLDPVRWPRPGLGRPLRLAAVTVLLAVAAAAAWSGDESCAAPGKQARASPATAEGPAWDPVPSDGDLGPGPDGADPGTAERAGVVPGAETGEANYGAEAGEANPGPERNVAHPGPETGRTNPGSVRKATRPRP